MSKLKFDTWENPDGTENYKCRAWVNFNGTGTVAIRASGNVSSITDNGVGDYTVNLATALPDADYSVSGVCTNNQLSGANSFVVGFHNSEAPTTSGFRIIVQNTGSAGGVDVDKITLAIFR